ncbi:hypothetical protein EDB89DRAFT_1912707 [Lactarius sanguifluus]|nr:hypothetical protein EDB89DRAFT_1912707 [Lactarius sanguifluus]
MSVCVPHLKCPAQQSLKKIVMMLGCIQQWQQDSNPDLVQSRPASNSCCQDYIKSVMVEARRLRIHSPQQLTLPTSHLRSANFDVTKGTILEYELCPEQFTEVMATIHARFPNSGVVKHIQIVHHLRAQQFFSQWLDVVRAADGVCDADIQLSTKFHEDDTRNAFLSFSACLNNIEVAAKSTQDEVSVVRQCTNWFSPSKFQAMVQHFPATATDPQRFIPHDAFSMATPLEYPVRFPLPPQFLIPTSQPMAVVGGHAAAATPLQHSVSTTSAPPVPRTPPLLTSAQNLLATVRALLVCPFLRHLLTLCHPTPALGLSHFSIASTQDAAAWDISSELVGNALGLSQFSITSTQDAAATTWDISLELVGDALGLSQFSITSTQDAAPATWDNGLELVGNALGLDCFNITSTQDTGATADIGLGLVGDALNLDCLSIASTQDTATTAQDISSELVGNIIATTWDIGSELIGDGLNHMGKIQFLYHKDQCTHGHRTYN